MRKDEKKRARSKPATLFKMLDLVKPLTGFMILAVCSGCRSCPLFQDGVASLAQVSVSCGLGDVVSHPAGRSVVNEHFFFLCEGNYSIPLAIRQ